MADPVDSLENEIVQSVANANFKTLAEQVSSNIAAHQMRVNAIAEASLGQILNKLNGLDPAEAVSAKKVIESDLSKAVSDLGFAVAAIQQLMKGAQTTPPPTP